MVTNCTGSTKDTTDSGIHSNVRCLSSDIINPRGLAMPIHWPTNDPKEIMGEAWWTTELRVYK